MLLGRTALPRVIAGWLAVALVIGGLASLGSPATRAAFVPLQPSDPLMHAPRGDADGVYRFAEAVGSARLPDTRAYLDEIYRLAPLVGLDPAILVGQSALETGYWRGKFWKSDLNPAGIGITDDDQPTSFHWETGTDAARGHVYHLYVYAAGVPPAGHLLDQYRHLDPRVQNAVDAGYAGTKTTIQALEGSWATMALYAQGLCNKANEILGYAERTTTTPTRTTTPTPPPATPKVVLSKVTSKFNGVVTATLTGFTPNTDVSLRWPQPFPVNATDPPSTDLLASGATDPQGAATLSFRTPLQPFVNAGYVVTARDGAGKAATASLRVIPRILLNEDEGTRSTRLRVYFYGFGPGERIEVRWHAGPDGTSASSVLFTLTVAENGRAVSRAFTPPAGALGGHKVVGKVIGVGRSASTPFVLLAGAGSVDDSSTATATSTATVTPTPVATASSTPAASPTPEATATAEPTWTPTATATREATPSGTPTPEPTATATGEPNASPVAAG